MQVHLLNICYVRCGIEGENLGALRYNKFIGLTNVQGELRLMYVVYCCSCTFAYVYVCMYVCIKNT